MSEREWLRLVGGSMSGEWVQLDLMSNGYVTAPKMVLVPAGAPPSQQIPALEFDSRETYTRRMFQADGQHRSVLALSSMSDIEVFDALVGAPPHRTA